MASDNGASSSEVPPALVPLGQYETPKLPTDQTVQKLWASLKDVFDQGDEEAPLLPADALDRAERENRDRIAPRPAADPGVRALEAGLATWLGAPSTAERVRVVVLPPNAEADPMTLWAEGRGLSLLPTVPRTNLIDAPEAPDLAGDGVLVIPRLQDWFVRHEHGLATIRRLVAEIVASDRQILIGCNSWAWDYLSKTAGAALALPRPSTFAAMDGPALEAWMADLSAASRQTGLNLRLASDGSEIFGAEANEKTSAHFKRLAARSMGIPWVAWTIWRASVSDFHPDGDTADERAIGLNDPDTFWISTPSAPTLPQGYEQNALLVVHALLIHGALEPELIARLLPIPDLSPLLTTLVEGGVLRRKGQMLTVASMAYPAMRNALNAAGFPMDRL